MAVIQGPWVQYNDIQGSTTIGPWDTHSMEVVTIKALVEHGKCVEKLTASECVYCLGLLSLRTTLGIFIGE